MSPAIVSAVMMIAVSSVWTYFHGTCGMTTSAAMSPRKKPRSLPGLCTSKPKKEHNQPLKITRF
jgi:hypothetical protein